MIVFVVGAALGGVRVKAQEVGGYAGAFLRNALTAGDAAMGGAFVPFVSNGDGSAIFDNSSALARLERPMLLASYTSLSFGRGLQSFGYGMRVGEFLGISAGVVSYGVGDVASYDAAENPRGTINSRDLAFSLGAGMAVGPANIGATLHYLKFVPGSADPATAGYSVDLSGTWEFEQVITRRDWLAASVIVNNVAGEMTNVHDVVPVMLRVGGAYMHPLDEDRVTSARLDPSGGITTRRLKPRSYILGSLEARFAQHDSSPILSAALEWAPVAEIPFGARIGYATNNDIATGIFINLPLPVDFARNIRLDLASRRDYEVGEISYHVSLTAGF